MNVHVMLDFETWGTKPGCALRSIGAVTFDPLDWSFQRNEFYRNISDDRPRDPKTEKWWSEQSPEAVAVLSIPTPISVNHAMAEFRQWFIDCGASFIWSHGSVFDVPHAETAFANAWLSPPWDFRNVCDTRTLFRAACVSVQAKKHRSIKHYALHDAHNQADAVELAFASLALHRW